VEQQKGIVEIVSEKVWKFFSSVKLAVVLLIILAIVSVIGTVIQQNEAPEKYLQEYSAATVQLFEAIGFFDMYHTWWFVLLLFLLTANLTICTLDRFPRTWSIITARLKPIDDEGLKAVPFKKEVAFKGGMDKAEARASQALQAAGFRYLVSGGPGVHHLYSQKGVYSRLGVYITHTSIILIFMGALLGAFFGFKGVVNIQEGERLDKVYVRNEPLWDQIMAAIGVGTRKVAFDPQFNGPALHLGFSIQCDDFEVDYYQNQGIPTGMPKEYYSILSVFDSAGRPIIKHRRIEVNAPLTYRGMTFYQSSYGMIPGAAGKIVLIARPKNSMSPGELAAVDPGGSVYVKAIDRTIKVIGIAPFGFRDSATGQVMYSRSQELINPVVQLEVYKGKSPIYKTEVMKVDSGEPYMPEDYTITYYDYWGARYTGLQVTKDPGVWVVYTGFILLCIGPLIAFFGSHRKIWVRILDRKGHASITVAGSANRNRLGFEREFNRIVEKIAK
jgi:cytochrome c biogenesis protein